MGDAVTMTEAARRLGITRVTLGRLVREGLLPVMENPLDRRQRLIPTRAIEDLLSADRERPEARHADSMSAPPRRFESDGIASNPDAVRSDRIEEYLREHW